MKQPSAFPHSHSALDMIDALRQVDSQFSLESMYHWPGLRVVFRHRVPATDLPEFHDVLQGAGGRILLVLGVLEGPKLEAETVRFELLAKIREIGATAQSPLRVIRVVQEHLGRFNRGRAVGVYCHFLCGQIDPGYTQLAYCQAGCTAWLSLVSPRVVLQTKPTGEKLGLLPKSDLGESVVSLFGVERLILGTGSDGGATPAARAVPGDRATDDWRDSLSTLGTSLAAGGPRSKVAKTAAWRAAPPASAMVMVELRRSKVEEWGPLACEQVRKCGESSDLSLDPCVFLG